MSSTLCRYSLYFRKEFDGRLDSLNCRNQTSRAPAKLLIIKGRLDELVYLLTRMIFIPLWSRM